MHVCISVTVQLPSSVHFQKMLENSISKRWPFSFLKHEDRLLLDAILSIGLICWLQSKATCTSGIVQLVLMYCHSICRFHFHCYQFAEHWKVLAWRIRANKLFMYLSVEMDSLLLCILLHHQLAGTFYTVFITICSFQYLYSIIFFQFLFEDVILLANEMYAFCWVSHPDFECTVRPLPYFSV